VNEFLSYTFSPLREGEIALYRGSGNGLAPILLVAADETSLGCVERLEHEYAFKSELDADWAARPVALTHSNGSMALVLEDPGGTPADRLLGRPLDVSHFRRIAIPLAAALRQMRCRNGRRPLHRTQALHRCVHIPCRSRQSQVYDYALGIMQVCGRFRRMIRPCRSEGKRRFPAMGNHVRSRRRPDANLCRR
jgi:hypothetical protein